MPGKETLFALFVEWHNYSYVPGGGGAGQWPISKQMRTPILMWITKAVDVHSALPTDPAAGPIRQTRAGVSGN
jgi:hypothetical protein